MFSIKCYRMIVPPDAKWSERPSREQLTPSRRQSLS